VVRVMCNIVMHRSIVVCALTALRQWCLVTCRDLDSSRARWGSRARCMLRDLVVPLAVIPSILSVIFVAKLATLRKIVLSGKPNSGKKLVASRHQKTDAGQLSYAWC
jgi:hypothetical protein